MAQVQLWYLWFTDVMRKVGMCTKQMPLWRALKPQWISSVNIFWLKKKKMPLMMLQDGIYYCIILPWVLRGNRVIIMTLETENLLRIKSLWDPIRNMEGILDSMRRNRLSKISQHKNTTLCYLRCRQIMSGKNLFLKETQKRGDMCTCITDWLCCTAETNKAL